jgi:hypothetical protein
MPSSAEGMYFAWPPSPARRAKPGPLSNAFEVNRSHKRKCLFDRGYIGFFFVARGYPICTRVWDEIAATLAFFASGAGRAKAWRRSGSRSLA